MPKVLLYITARFTWIFLFYGTDYHENRAHVHVGKQGTDKLCKIWLEPNITIADPGELTPTQQKQVLQIATDNKDALLKQWQIFKTGKNVKLLTIKK